MKETKMEGIKKEKGKYIQERETETNPSARVSGWWRPADC